MKMGLEVKSTVLRPLSMIQHKPGKVNRKDQRRTNLEPPLRINRIAHNIGRSTPSGPMPCMAMLGDLHPI
jgi:hypothetical protein